MVVSWCRGRVPSPNDVIQKIQDTKQYQHHNTKVRQRWSDDTLFWEDSIDHKMDV